MAVNEDITQETPQPEPTSSRPPIAVYAALAVAVVLVVVGLWAYADQRRDDRAGYQALVSGLADRMPAAQVLVTEKAVRNGAVYSKVEWTAPDRTDAPSADRSFWIAGERLRVETGTVRVRHRSMDDDAEPPAVHYFRYVSGGDEERQNIYPQDAVPPTHRLRGDMDSHTRKAEQRFWAAVLGDDENGERLTVDRQAGERVEVDLTIGNRFELRIDGRGMLSVTPVLETGNRLANFSLDHVASSDDGLSFRVIETERTIEHNGRIHPGFDARLVTVEIRNDGDEDRQLALIDFVMEDGRGNSSNSRNDAVLSVPAKGALNAKLEFLVPVFASGLELRLPSVSDAAGKPIELFLGPKEAGIGDPVFAGDFAFVVTDFKLRVDDDHFEGRIELIALNQSDKNRELEPDQFTLSVPGSRNEFEAASLSATEFEPDEPTALVVIIPLGTSLTAEDLRLDITDARRRVEQQHAKVTMLPAFGGEAQLEAGKLYLDRLAATSHYAKWIKLTTSGALSKLFGGKARAAEAAAHLRRAKELYPDSQTIGAARP